MRANGGENFRRQVVELMRRHVARYKLNRGILEYVILLRVVFDQLRYRRVSSWFSWALIGRS